MEKELNHFDKNGNAVMVDISGKASTMRTALAKGKIKMSPEAFLKVTAGTMGKGDVLGVARIAGIMGVKKTSALIPLCHPILTEKATIEFEYLEEERTIEVQCEVKVQGQTGVEMEALTGVNIALLTIYDMCKAVDKSMVMYDIHLAEKTGGKSGSYKA